MIKRKPLVLAIRAAMGLSLGASVGFFGVGESQAVTPIDQLSQSGDQVTMDSALSQSAAFEQLDNNSDGYISEREAGAHPTLADNWQQADANSDGHIDQAEFSAFESVFLPESGSRPMDSPGGGGMGTR